MRHFIAKMDRTDCDDHWELICNLYEIMPDFSVRFVWHVADKYINESQLIVQALRLSGVITGSDRLSEIEKNGVAKVTFI